MFFKRIFYFWSLICVFVLLLCCVFILFNAFWYFLVLLVLLALFVLLKSYREKKFKTDLITSFILLRPYFIYNVKKRISMSTSLQVLSWPNFFIKPVSSVRWYISFLHFKAFKVRFHLVPLVHYVLVPKIQICMPNMTLGSMLTLRYPFYYC